MFYAANRNRRENHVKECWPVYMQYLVEGVSIVGIFGHVVRRSVVVRDCAAVQGVWSSLCRRRRVRMSAHPVQGAYCTMASVCLEFESGIKRVVGENPLVAQE